MLLHHRGLPRGTPRNRGARLALHLHHAVIALLVVAVAVASASAAEAQVAPPAVHPSGNPAPAPASTPAPTCHCLPAGTAVDIEITETLVSNERKAGDAFALRLARPIMLEGVEVVPAGTTGVGEVIHAAPARASGKAGELILAARYLDWHGVRIPLRATRLGGAGNDRSGVVAGATIAIGVFALFIHGGQMQIPTGTPAQAKLAQALPLSTIPSTGPSPDGLTPTIKE